MTRCREFALRLWMPACLLAGCASERTVGLDSALFPRDGPPTCTSRSPGRARLQVPEAVLSTLSEALAQQRLQVGKISAEALLRAMDEFLKDGGRQVAAATGPGADGAATLSIESLHYAHQDHLLWFLPLPWVPIAQSEVRATLSFELRLLDAQGLTVWTRSYSDDGARLTHSSLEARALIDGVPRLAHEAAWRLAQRAVRDLREWIDAQRLAPRDL